MNGDWHDMTLDELAAAIFANLTGDGNGNNASGLAEVDSTIPSHPVIRVRLDRQFVGTGGYGGGAGGYDDGTGGYGGGTGGYGGGGNGTGGNGTGGNGCNCNCNCNGGGNDKPATVEDPCAHPSDESPGGGVSAHVRSLTEDDSGGNGVAPDDPGGVQGGGEAHTGDDNCNNNC